MKLGVRHMLFGAVVLAIPVSSWFLVFRPQNREICQAENELELKNLTLAKLREETSRTSDMKKANEDIAQSIANIEARLPRAKEVDAVVRQVTELAVGVGLSPPSFKSSKPLDAALYREQPLELSTQGDFASFYQFLIRLEQLPRLTRIMDLKLSKDGEHEGRIEAKFTLSIYFQEEKPAPAPSAPAATQGGAR